VVADDVGMNHECMLIDGCHVAQPEKSTRIAEVPFIGGAYGAG
jgi:hypothetical protein